MPPESLLLPGLLAFVGYSSVDIGMTGVSIFADTSMNFANSYHDIPFGFSVSFEKWRIFPAYCPYEENTPEIASHKSSVFVGAQNWSAITRISGFVLPSLSMVLTKCFESAFPPYSQLVRMTTAFGQMSRTSLSQRYFAIPYALTGFGSSSGR